MRNFLKIAGLVAAVAFLILVLLGNSQEVVVRPDNCRLNAIYLKGKDRWYPLDGLIDTAWQYVTSKTNVPLSERRSFVVWIDREDTNQLSRISFGAGVGQQFWEARIGLDGQPGAYITGSTGDRVISRPAPK